MGTDSECGIAGGSQGSGRDYISGLPDSILQSILLRLEGTEEAARTSVVARRWRSVWAELPELSLSMAHGHGPVDAALAAYSAPTVRRLEIKMPQSLWSRRVAIPADCVSSWLDFASLHLAGELRLKMPFVNMYTKTTREKEEIVLPLCERVTAIFLTFHGETLRFRLPAAGVFSALATLSISNVYVDGQELEDVLCSRCPCLKQLVLDAITVRGGAHVFPIRSDSLERLEVDWKTNIVYRPSHCHFAESGRHLQRLAITVNYGGWQLMQRFDTVKELVLDVQIEQGIQQYNSFLENTKKLATCEVLVARLDIEHACKPTLLHLLRKCAGLRKLVVQVQLGSCMVDYLCKSLSGCPCGCLENRRTNNIVLDSLEEVEIRGYGDKVELVRLFVKLSARCEKRLSITVSESWKATREEISSICPPDDKVEIVVRST
ncbi:unnamed protein product [Urochloa decumbens]|uniref:F-box domain-containing protein n=1 Tax=Urochloa decumbens TaxID=240449 RepID=A0ABC9G3U2_9POAL